MGRGKDEIYCYVTDHIDKFGNAMHRLVVLLRRGLPCFGMPSANYGSTSGAGCGFRDGGRTQSTIGKPISTTTPPGYYHILLQHLLRYQLL